MATVLIENLTKIYPPTITYPHRVQALGGVNMSVTGNVFVAVLGPSGSGKTTLLNIVAGVETPTSGSVRAVQDGVPAQVGYVFQEPRLLPWRTVLNNMLYVQDRKSDRSRREAEFYLTMVGLNEVAHLYPSQLSAGMQQRVGIARAFLVNPDILLMDEPFSHMDALTGRSLRGVSAEGVAAHSQDGAVRDSRRVRGGGAGRPDRDAAPRRRGVRRHSGQPAEAPQP